MPGNVSLKKSGGKYTGTTIHKGTVAGHTDFGKILSDNAWESGWTWILSADMSGDTLYASSPAVNAGYTLIADKDAPEQSISQGNTAIIEEYFSIIETEDNLNEENFVSANVFNEFVKRTGSDLDSIEESKAGAVTKSEGGIIASLYDSAASPVKALRIYGKCTQRSTPSPQNPAAITSAGDDGSCKVTAGNGNLFFLTAGDTYTRNGVTAAVCEDGSVIATGTPTVTSGSIMDINGGRLYPEDLIDGVTYKSIDASMAAKRTDGSINYVTSLVWDSALYTEIRVYLAISFAKYTDGKVYKPMVVTGDALEDIVMGEKNTVTITGLNAPLRGIPVSSGGNVTIDGQEYAADCIDSVAKRLIRKCGYIESYSGEDVGTDYMSTTGDLSEGASVVYVLREETVEALASTGDETAVEDLKMYKPLTKIYSNSNAYLEVEYTADTKAYIDNKFKELRNAVLALGGNV